MWMKRKIQFIQGCLDWISQGRLPHFRLWVEWYYPSHTKEDYKPWRSYDDIPF